MPEIDMQYADDELEELLDEPERELWQRAQDSFGWGLRQALIRQIVQRLDYATHEVPSGLLAEPHEFDADLRELETLTATQGTQSKYAVLLDEWRFYADTSADYARRGGEFGSDADYLRRAVPEQIKDHWLAYEALRG
jgi:hypothetical protein